MHAVVTVIGPDGEIVSQQGVTSGGMTPEQAALGFPRSTLSTHVEAKSVDRIPLKEGQAMVIEADRRPCPSCRGAMNRTARETGATIIYTWGDNEWVAWPS